MQINSVQKLWCCLTDEFGIIVNPYEQNSIHYSELTIPNNRTKGKMKYRAGKEDVLQYAQVAMEGYITVFADEKCVSEPIPFCFEKLVCIIAPEYAVLKFRTLQFSCCAAPVFNCATFTVEQMHICVNITAMVRAQDDLEAIASKKHALCPENDLARMGTGSIYDSFFIRSCGCGYHQMKPLKAEVYQYNASAKQNQKIFTNEDELVEYGQQGILSPTEVSYYNLFINGVLQPKANYDFEEGYLELLTADAPPEGAPVILTFITLQSKQAITVTNQNYNTVSDGRKMTFYNKDELKKYGDRGIPDPNKVSCYQLYVNGVLQPPVNYRVQKGTLQFVTNDIPQPGTVITLESLAMRGKNNMLRWAEQKQYSAFAHEGSCYTNRDAIRMYDNCSISAGDNSSYHFLSVNGVVQPPVNYLLQDGRLILTTKDRPLDKTPITLQYVDVF